jgi:hypothetical protein
MAMPTEESARAALKIIDLKDKRLFAIMLFVGCLMMASPLLGLTGQWRLLTLIPLAVSVAAAFWWRSVSRRLKELGDTSVW